MAAMASQSGTSASSHPGGGSADEPARLPMPSRNPIPLSASQEAQVRDIFYARVRRICAPEIQGPSVRPSIASHLGPQAPPMLQCTPIQA